MADENVLSQTNIDAIVASNLEEADASTGTEEEALAIATSPPESVKAAPEKAATSQQQPVYVESAVDDKQEPKQPKASRSISATPASQDRESLQLADFRPQIESLYAMMADLTKRLTKIETAMSKFDQMEKAIAEARSSTSQSPQALHDLEEQFEDLNDQLDDFTEKLSASLGYNIGNIHQCNHCGSEGLVAIRVKCTECGDENWLGWWPPKE